MHLGQLLAALGSHYAVISMHGDRVRVQAPAPLPGALLDGVRVYKAEIAAAWRARGSVAPCPTAELICMLPRAWPRLIASTVVPATDTHSPYDGRVMESADAEPPRGTPGEVVAITTRPGTTTLLTLLGEPRAMQQMAQAAGMKPLVVALIGSDGQMRAITRG